MQNKESKTRRVMVHQTSLAAATAILQSQQMLLGKEGGIFFARTAPETDCKAQQRGTYLIADVYLGYTKLGVNSDVGSAAQNVNSILIKGNYGGFEYVSRDPNRVKNIRYLDGAKPPNYAVQMRKRMPLIYATTAQDAAKIIKYQKIPKEYRPDIAGNGRYFWDNIPDAKAHSKTGSQTFLVADVYFTKCYDKKRSLPKYHDYKFHDTFRGIYQNVHYYMVKYSNNIERIHYISGVRPPPI